MSPIDWAIWFISGLLELAILVAMLRAHRYRYCYSFLVYLGAQLAVTVTGLLNPVVYQDWLAWTVKESAYAVLRLVLLAEIVLLIFRALPRARNRAVLLMIVDAILLAVALSRKYDLRSAYTLAVDITSRMSYITVWSLIAILALVAWHRLPLHHLHKAIFHGMLWLLLAHFFGVYAAGWLGGVPAWLVYRGVQLAVYVVWLRAAWTVDPTIGGDEAAVIRYLQPWRKP